MSSKSEERDRLSDEIVNLLEGTDASALNLVLEKLGIGVVTKHLVVKRNKLLCDPIIWVAEDLESITLSEWHAEQGYKTLNERSIEEGQQIRADLEWMIANKISI